MKILQIAFASIFFVLSLNAFAQTPKESGKQRLLREIAVSKDAEFKVLDALYFNTEKITRLMRDTSVAFSAKKDSLAMLILQRKKRIEAELSPEQIRKLELLLSEANKQLNSSRQQQDRHRQEYRAKSLPAGVRIKRIETDKSLSHD